MEIFKGNADTFESVQMIDYVIELCSICCTRGECKNIFDMEYKEQSASFLFSYCTKIQVSYSDNPCFMCFTCIGKLLNTYEFIKKCEMAWNFCKRFSINSKKGRSKARTFANIARSEVVVEAPKAARKENVMVQEVIEIKDEEIEEDEIKVESIINITEDLNASNGNTMSFNNNQSTTFDTIESHDNNLLHDVQEQEMVVEMQKDENEVDPLIQPILRKVCKHCPQIFNNDAHRKSHHQNKHLTQEKCKTERTVCTFCRKTYSTVKQLKSHMIEHKALLVPKRFTCHLCNKIFRTYTYLQKHLSVHTGEKPYICQECNQTFHQKKQLRAHLPTHNEKPFHCNYCLKVFSQVKILHEHVRTVHKNVKPYGCKICNKNFSKLTSLADHLESHSNRNTCEFCLKPSIDASDSATEQLPDTNARVLPLYLVGVLEKCPTYEGLLDTPT